MEVRGEFAPIVLALAGGGRVAHEDILLILKLCLAPELRARRLLKAPPRLLGFVDEESWNRRSLESLATLAFDFAVTRRLESLHAKVGAFGNIDPLVRRNVANFVSEQQTKADPAGAKVYERLRAGAGELVQGGQLRRTRSEGSELPEGDEPLLAAPPPPPPGRALTAAWTEIADAEPTRRNVREILARGQAGTNAARAILLDLLAVDLTRLTVGGATRQVAPKARTELRALLEDGSADVSEPFLSLADTESWSDLRGVVHRVAARLRAGGHAQAEAVLWALIRRADDSGLTEVKQAELVLDLGIPRSTISEHVKTLRRLFREELGTRARSAG